MSSPRAVSRGRPNHPPPTSTRHPDVKRGSGLRDLLGARRGSTCPAADRVDPRALEHRDKLHWVRDVTFDEDRSQVRVGNAPQVMASLRNTIISLHRRAGHTNIARACRRHAADPIRALNLILNT